MESTTISKEQFYPSESFIDVYDQYLREMIYANPNKRKLKLKNNWFLDLVFWIAKCKNSSKSCPIFFNQNSPSYLAQSWILIFWLQWYVINYDIHQCIASIFSKSLSSSPPWKGWHSLVSNLPQSSWSKEEYWKLNFHFVGLLKSNISKWPQKNYMYTAGHVSSYGQVFSQIFWVFSTCSNENSKMNDNNSFESP